MSDEEEEAPQDQKVPTNNRAGYEGVARFRPGFGFDGPSEEWKRARGLIKPTYTGGSGTTDSAPQQVTVDEPASRSPEQDAIRRRRFLEMADCRQEQLSRHPIEPPRPVPIISAEEESRRKKLADLRERGLEESKQILENYVPPAPQSPTAPALTQERLLRQRELTEWIDSQKPEAAETIRKQFVGLRHVLAEMTNPDIWIELDSGERIGAHRAVLAARSSVFKSMLCSHMQEEALNTVHMGGFSLEAVQSLLEYLYTGSLASDTHHILELLYLSSAYFLSGLKSLIERRLTLLANPEQVTMLLDAAEATESWQLREDLVNYCLLNKIDLQRAGVWSQLSLEFKKEIASRSALSA